MKNKIYSLASAGLLLGAMLLGPVTPVLAVVQTYKVHVGASVNGSFPTLASLSNEQFQLTQTLSNSAPNNGSSTLTLGTGMDPNAYVSDSPDIKKNGSYSLTPLSSNILPLDSECVAGKFVFQGFVTSSISLQDALDNGGWNGNPLTINDLSADQYVVMKLNHCGGDNPPVTNNTVHIMKTLDGSEPNANTINGHLFKIDASWNDPSVNSGATSTAIINLGDNSDPNHLYEANSVTLSDGSSFSLSEVADQSTGVLPPGESCNNVMNTYHLDGYKVSSVSFADAIANGTFYSSTPTLSNITSDMYVVVVNTTCPCDTNVNTTYQVHTMKVLDGSEATTQSANSALFPVSETLTASNINGGAQQQTFLSLGNGSDVSHPYVYVSPMLATGADYAIEESIGGDILANDADCVAGKFKQDGYKSSAISFADAVANGAWSSTAPSFTNLTSDEYVVIMNQTCANGGGGDTTYNIHVMKILDGSEANASSTSNLFTLTENIQASNINGGNATTTTLTLGNNQNPNILYQATSANIAAGGSYSISENTGTSTNTIAFDADCVPGMYKQDGYKYSATSFQDAISSGSWSSTGPSFTNLASDQYVVVMNQTCANGGGGDTTHKVHYMKVLDGSEPTVNTIGGHLFKLDTSWNDPSVNSGATSTEIINLGDNSDQNHPYEADSVALHNGSSLTLSEVADQSTGVLPIGESCNNMMNTYDLQGYKVSSVSFADAMANGTFYSGAPTLSNITADMYVVIINNTCPCDNMGGTFQVHFMKTVDGATPTATSTNNLIFMLSATTTASNINGGNATSSVINLGNNQDTNHLYEADSMAIASGGSISFNEQTGGSTNTLPSGSACVEGMYRVQGYKVSSVSFADALANGTFYSSAPTLSGILSNKYVVVMNTLCTSQGTGTLGVSAIQNTTGGSATPDNTFDHGLKFLFTITVPTNELNLSMKFSDWMNTATGSSATIPVANNMRISSAQADNGGAAVTLTAANTYSSPALHMTGDMDPNTAGKQVQVLVETKVPVGTAAGSYSTNYSIQTLP